MLTAHFNITFEKIMQLLQKAPHTKVNNAENNQHVSWYQTLFDS